MKLHWFLLLAFFTPSVLFGELGPIPGTQPVKPVFDKATLVCDCRIESATAVKLESPSTEGGESVILRVTASVLDIYKSDADTTSQVEFDCPADLSPIVHRGEVVLLFVSRNDAGGYQLTDRFIGLTNFRSIPMSSEDHSFTKLQNSLASIVLQPDRDDVLNALRLLEGFDSIDKTTLAIVDQSASSNDHDVAFAALGVLLSTGTPESVRRLKAYIDGHAGEGQPMELVSVGTKLARVKDARALPDIEALSSCGYVSIRDGAMEAIRHFANRESAAVVVQRLDDTDPNIQFSAVITLATIFGKGGDYGPSRSVFVKDPEKYTSLWKQWWTDEGSSQPKN